MTLSHSPINKVKQLPPPLPIAQAAIESSDVVIIDKSLNKGKQQVTVPTIDHDTTRIVTEDSDIEVQNILSGKVIINSKVVDK